MTSIGSIADYLEDALVSRVNGIDVAVTGTGLVSALGGDAESTWDGTAERPVGHPRLARPGGRGVPAQRGGAHRRDRLGRGRPAAPEAAGACARDPCGRRSAAGCRAAPPRRTPGGRHRPRPGRLLRRDDDGGVGRVRDRAGAGVVRAGRGRGPRLRRCDRGGVRPLRASAHVRHRVCGRQLRGRRGRARSRARPRRRRGRRGRRALLADRHRRIRADARDGAGRLHAVRRGEARDVAGRGRGTRRAAAGRRRQAGIPPRDRRVDRARIRCASPDVSA